MLNVFVDELSFLLMSSCVAACSVRCVTCCSAELDLLLNVCAGLLHFPLLGWFLLDIFADVLLVGLSVIVAEDSFLLLILECLSSSQIHLTKIGSNLVEKD